MQYSFTPQGLKSLKKFPIDTQRRIIRKLKHFLTTPDPLYFAKSLSNSPYGTYRYRVLGKIRVIFIYDDDQIIITRIRKRDKAYSR